MQNQPIAWRKVALAILPGILLVALDPWHDPAGFLLLGVILGACVVLCVVGFVRERTLAVWSLPAWGILLGVLMLLLGFSLLNGVSPTDQEVFFFLLLALYDTVPILVGLPLARKAGVLAGLVFVGAAYVLWGQITEPEYALSNINNSTLVSFVSICPQLFFLILAPVTVMHLSSTRTRIVGYLVIISVALIVVAGIDAVRSYSSFARTIGLDFAFVVLPLLIALGLYAAIGRRTLASSPSSQP